MGPTVDPETQAPARDEIQDGESEDSHRPRPGDAVLQRYQFWLFPPF